MNSEPEVHFPEALNKALCSTDHRWFFESKYGGAPLEPTGVTWRIDRLWRLIDDVEDLSRWFKRIKLHCMFPSEWRGHYVPMHRHHPGAVVIAPGSNRRASDPLYINRVAPPLDAFNETIAIAEHVLKPPFVYKIDRDSQHSVGFIRAQPGIPFYTITLIPNDGLSFDKWPPTTTEDTFVRLFDLKHFFVDRIDKHFRNAHEGKRMIDE